MTLGDRLKNFDVMLVIFHFVSKINVSWTNTECIKNQLSQLMKLGHDNDTQIAFPILIFWCKSLGCSTIKPLFEGQCMPKFYYLELAMLKSLTPETKE